jgi:hypothetical protein
MTFGGANNWFFESKLLGNPYMVRWMKFTGVVEADDGWTEMVDISRSGSL